jgi:glycosyltransferase involved in cell wall biosynthesis
MVRIAYIVTHPIQYQVPLLQYLSRSGGIELEVFFLSDFSLHEHYEQAFNRTFKWDVALTDGYKWEVLPRILIGPSTPLRTWWPVGWLRQRLREGRFDAVWVHGWGHVGLCQAVREAASLGLPVLLRGESTPDQQPQRTLRRRLRDAFCRRLFQQVAGFLCIGARNREFYRQFGVPEDLLFSMPYAVDNAFFQARCAEARPQRETLRQSLGLQPGRPVILFAAKFTKVKAPEELLAAFTLLPRGWVEDAAPYLVFVGDGPLRGTLEKRARPLGDAVRFLGFRNQSELPALYDLCDVFALPSRFEPWGLVVNEAMNAGRPVIVSDRVGAAPDLVEDGENGFVYPSGDVAALVSKLRRVVESPSLCAKMGQSSLEKITSWDFEADHKGLVEAIKAVYRKTQAQASTPVLVS